MKKIILMLVILMTAILGVNAQCRVVGYSRSCPSTSDRAFMQIDAGMNVSPHVGFSGDFVLGYKNCHGVTAGLHVNGQYTSAPSVGAGLAIAYEFSALRKYTGIFYPVIGVEGGFSWYKNTPLERWDAFPHLGYKAGFFFEALPGWIDVGLEYNGSYNFATEKLAPNSKSFLDHNIGVAIRLYL